MQSIEKHAVQYTEAVQQLAICMVGNSPRVQSLFGSNFCGEGPYFRVH